MNTAAYVDRQIAELKASGIPLQDAAWKAALLCIGWPYVFGGRGQYCTPSNRRSMNWKSYPNIREKCRNFDGNGTCDGCEYYPGGKVRYFDCRGFTYWILLQIYGWKLMGAGATTQWNNAGNWQAKGLIADGMPRDTLVCLFYKDRKDPSKMAHTGFGFNDETVECSAGVQHFKTRNRKWTHWAVPACIGRETQDGGNEMPTTPTTRPTLRRGDRGDWVTLLQADLHNKGYDLGRYGVDGDFGSATEAAVKAFQLDAGLTADGIVGPKTWEALDAQVPAPEKYTVTVPHLSKAQAEALTGQYAGATMTGEGR